MKVKTSFPINAQNRKAVREQLLLDSTGSGVEDALFSAANNAKTPDQKVFVSRSYGYKGRLAVWIVDDRVTLRGSGTGTLRDRTKALKETLARVRL